MVLSDQWLEGTLDENGTKCISLVLAEAGINKEELGGFVFKNRWRSTTRPLSTLCLLLSCGESLGSRGSSAMCRGAGSCFDAPVDRLKRESLNTRTTKGKLLSTT